ncbi:MAG: efflux RND transporter periplasmic adaptor subunit, partial [Cyclobacteriaceae bacterium]|nr:efflux RND transporter periplasmic adaptor subunit [Cyclobacteriaceae bacterium]
DLAEISAQVNQAQNAVDKAARDLTRIQNLYKDSVATLEQLQDLQTVHQVAQADLRIASFNQKYARIKAPFAGKVLKRHAEQGELVNPGIPILTVGNHHSTSYVMRVAMADKDIVRLALQDSAHLYFDAYPQQVFKAYISELAEAADPRTGTFEVELTANNAHRNLKNGFVGKVMIFPSSQEPYYQISMSALVEGDQERAKIFTYQQREQKAQLLEVKPHDIKADYFTVLAREQAPFSHVITEGAPYLKHGQSVKPISSQP